MGKIWCKLWAKFAQFMCHILPMVFLHSKFLKDFNSHSHTGSDSSVRVREGRGISIHTPVQEWQEYSHKIKISATQLVFVFLPYKRILAHKRAFFNRNLKPSHLEFYKFNADSVIQHLCIKISCVVKILKKIA